MTSALPMTLISRRGWCPLLLPSGELLLVYLYILFDGSSNSTMTDWPSAFLLHSTRSSIKIRSHIDCNIIMKSMLFMQTWNDIEIILKIFSYYPSFLRIGFGWNASKFIFSWWIYVFCKRLLSFSTWNSVGAHHLLNYF